MRLFRKLIGAREENVNVQTCGWNNHKWEKRRVETMRVTGGETTTLNHWTCSVCGATATTEKK